MQTGVEVKGLQSGQEEWDKSQIVEHSPKGRFIRFNELIGSGAYKLVYRGYDNDTGREIAWVVIKLSRLTLNERRRMVEEILLLKSLNHPNIIGFINQWTVRARNEVVFITELMNGGSLKRYIRKIRRPRLKHIKSWSKAILEGLNYLHSQSIPIVHRDIKCDNIFISASSNEIRIGDLGLAGFTSKAPAIGTPNFMAPQAFYSKVSPATDIYAFGMCVLEMATLQTPYDQCQCVQDIIRRVQDGIKPEAIRSIINQNIRQIIASCLSQNPNERPSAYDLLRNPFFCTQSPEDNLPLKLKTERQPQLVLTARKSEIVAKLNERKKLFRQLYEDYSSRLVALQSPEELHFLQKQENKLLSDLHREHKIKTQAAKKGTKARTNSPQKKRTGQSQELSQCIQKLRQEVSVEAGGIQKQTVTGLRQLVLSNNYNPNISSQ